MVESSLHFDLRKPKSMEITQTPDDMNKPGCHPIDSLHRCKSAPTQNCSSSILSRENSDDIQNAIEDLQPPNSIFRSQTLEDLVSQEQWRESHIGTKSSPTVTRDFVIETLQTIQHNPWRKTPHCTFVNPFDSSLLIDSRKTSDSTDSSTYLRPNAFEGHRDTLARLPRIRLPSEECDSSSDSTPTAATEVITMKLLLPSFLQDQNGNVNKGIIHLITRYLEFEDYKNLRLVCRSWLNVLPLERISTAMKIPQEVLEQILWYLSPADFHAAKHTCKSWFLASLDLKLGHSKIRAARCWHAFQADLGRRNEIFVSRLADMYSEHENEHVRDCHQPTVDDVISEEWLVAKRLATENRLCPHWRGLGIQAMDEKDHDRLHIIRVIDFESIIQQRYSYTWSSHSKTFNVSTCGKFLLVISANSVYVYELWQPGATIKPVVMLSAGRAVLKVSMDTTSQRFAVAALLTGHIGILWDLMQDEELGLTPNYTSGGQSPDIKTEGSTTSMIGSSKQGCDYFSHFSLEEALQTRSDAPSRRSSLGSDFCQTPRAMLLSSSSRTSSISTRRSFLESPRSESDDSYGEESIPSRRKASAIYTRLGNHDDPPRSVAICPQRKCVAFGSKTGIELYWIDGLSGIKLNRWFPLAGPSDYLYFLPQRPEFESTLKLRLISSAKPPLINRFLAAQSVSAQCHAEYDARRKSMTRLFFGNLPFPSSASVTSSPVQSPSVSDERSGVLRTVDCDHYLAVPLSDGLHLLFVDAETGHLCLGSDAPPSRPTKLLRKVTFVPKNKSDNKKIVCCYTASQELRWGLSVVSAYNDGSLVLYHIPSDVFDCIRRIRSSPDVWDETVGVLGQSDLMMDDFMGIHSNHARDGATTQRALSCPSRSLQIEGSLIMMIQGHDQIDDLALDCSNGGFHMWVFCRSGQAKFMSIYAPRHHEIMHSEVGRDGMIRNMKGKEKNTKGKGRAVSEETLAHVRWADKGKV